MRKLLSSLAAVALIGGTLTPVLLVSEQTQTKTTPTAAKNFVVDMSLRNSEQTSRFLQRQPLTQNTDSEINVDKALVFERKSITVVPAPKKAKAVKVVKTKKSITQTKKSKATKIVKKAKVKTKTKKASKIVKRKIHNPSLPSGTTSVVRIATRYYGVPYVWGGTTPRGFDCSGFTMYVFKKAGIRLPRVSRAQYAYTRKISRSQARPGDLVFFGSPVHHVGIYIGNGYMIHSPRKGKTVTKVKVNYVGKPKFGRVSR